MDQERRNGNTEFRNELEMLRLTHRRIEIIYRGANEARTVILDRVDRLLVSEGREWLRTGGGLLIGLDQLEEVDGYRPTGFC